MTLCIISLVFCIDPMVCSLAQLGQMCPESVTNFAVHTLKDEKVFFVCHLLKHISVLVAAGGVFM